MQIQEMFLSTPDLAVQKDFYQNVLKLPITVENDQQFTFKAGTTQLIFQQGPVDGVYHFAFNVPENQMAAAREWLSVPLIKANDGRDEFFSESWNSHSVYFYDPAGNILELIARHTLPDASTESFSEKSLLNISEIGVAVADVSAFTASSGLPSYGGSSPEFSPIGDENGLLIVVKIGRQWFPDTGKHALEIPLRAVITSNGTQMEINGTPHANITVK
jgi:catechol 2,3-dioxygenase-like lactoylglutathione lyase family enzyme